MLKTEAILTGSPLFSTFAVDDIDAARRFYQDTLGLDVRDGQMPGIFEIRGADRSTVTVYPKPDHKPAEFTVLNFVVDDVERTVDSLTAAGVRIEHYDSDDIRTDHKGIMRGNGPDIAWFRDPARNILSVIGRTAS